MKKTLITTDLENAATGWASWM